MKSRRKALPLPGSVETGSQRLGLLLPTALPQELEIVGHDIIKEEILIGGLRLVEHVESTLEEPLGFIPSPLFPIDIG